MSGAFHANKILLKKNQWETPYLLLLFNDREREKCVDACEYTSKSDECVCPRGFIMLRKIRIIKK